MNKERNIIIAKNIRRFLDDSNMSQKKLAELINIKPSTLSDYLNLRSNPSHGVIQRIADVFGVGKSDIDTTYKDENSITSIYDKLTPPRQKRVLDFANEQLNEQNNKVLHINSHNVISEEVAVYGYASAGTGETLIDGVEFTTQYNGHIPNHDFALQVNGDSMEPLFEDKEIIFIDKTKQINSGQIGIFVIDGEAYLKKVFINEEGIRLVSLNSKYPDLHFDSSHDIKVAGKVIL
ncbi:TPA: helix-turn-helix transcriptional regulator [Staphylococcus pseudintermedius]|uniref:XRE family transcriptional regulator n=1 Tax=Staphylococcus pseudintermedius TaxID=283734 RepID=UPI0022E9F95A|nr:XRE family transcriptional regulator [Staphylococcus pseudintermedius]MCE5808649.1 helix-turn-helix transcriptional regulator [Staphylococcus pseudintermedius]MDA3098055.1 XRE family transcriptional regulator [Staphylococcus pseudintermedius]MDE9833583.1 XRE family transcriptional regulator [Staphylococcus pseudintermedius]MDK3599151.1 XRE family transcriptional regulator [Staphylococcus pseudintermedius]HCT0377008.1 helix-turn-helix transcriptional regulator [Staphylococcus pseudintermediu